MKNVIIDLTDKKTKAEVHALFMQKLCLPDYYGANLDALFDCLTSYGEQLNLTVIIGAVPQGLEDWFEALADTLNDSAKETENVNILIQR